MTNWLVPPGGKGKGVPQQAAEMAAGKLATKALGTALSGGNPLVGEVASEVAGPLASQLVGSFFKEGGEAKKKDSIWGKITDKIASDFERRKKLFGGQRYNKKPMYKAIGGMTPGPLGMSDMMMAGKPKDVSAIKIKKAMGDMSEEVELNYHAPLAAKKPEGE